MKTTLFVFIFSCLTILSGFAQDITGKWYGRAELGMAKLPIEFDVQSSDDGYTGTWRSPEQGDREAPVTSVRWENDTLRINITPIDFVYIGELKESGKIEGFFAQHGNSYPLDLSREKITRPQDPQPPFPYKEEDITFKNEKAEIELRGTLTFPESGKDFTAVVLVSGSGAQNRDEALMGHRPFAVLADYLTRQGIAVLRYDDRGVGKSEGDYASSSIADFASDAQAAIEYLKTRKEINPKKIGIIGHSEGGVIAFMLAAEQIPAFIVSMAGIGVPGRELMNLQRAALLKANGAPEEFIAQYNQVVDGATELVLTVEDKDELVEKINTLTVGTPLFGSANILITQLSSPEMKSFLLFDPASCYPAIQCPALVLNGAKDLQVPAEENIQAMIEGFEQVGNIKVETKIYPGLNHLFQTAETGAIMEYAQIEETISPEVLEDIVAWLKKR